MSTTRQASKTALMTAAYRARASAWTTPLFDDPWAAELSGPEGVTLAAEYESGFPPMELWAALRTAYMDEHVRHWTSPARGFTQVVLLGAGLDTRAARLRSENVRFFEVDHPNSQRDKRERLSALSDYPACAATYVECDFEHDNFVHNLAAAGFDTSAPAIILWEGVTAYLTEAAVRATLHRVAHECDRRSVIVFDYLSRQMAEGKNIAEGDHKTRDVVSGLGEVFRFGSNDVLPLLADEGFPWIRVISFDEVCLSFGHGYDRERLFRFQRMAVASPTVHSPL